MVDLRELDGVLLKLEDARRRFERGGPPPVAVRDLIVELADELADSGPLGVGVSPRVWLRARSVARCGVESLGSERLADQCDGARKCLRRLRRVFRRASRLARWRARGLGSKRAWLAGLASVCLVLFAATYLVEAAIHGVAAVWLAPAVTVPLIVMSVTVWFWVPRMQLALEVDAALAAASEVLSGDRPLFGAHLRHGRRFVIATDSRIMQVERARRGDHTEVVWSLRYARVESFTSDRRGSGDSRYTCVTLRAGSQRFEIDLRGESYQHCHDRALLAILARRVETAKSETDTVEGLEVAR